MLPSRKLKYESALHQNCGIVNSTFWENDNNVVSASIQTLYARIESNEFKEFDEDKDYLIVDEASPFSCTLMFQYIIKYYHIIQILIIRCYCDTF